MRNCTLMACVLVVLASRGVVAWEVGDPMVSYWGGPGWGNHPEKLTERAALELKEGGYNTVWASSVEELNVAAKHGLRTIYQLPSFGPYFDPSDEDRCKRVAAEIAAVKDHPALYMYLHADEPQAGRFTELARAKRWVQAHDPKHPVWVNLLPTYANNKQLGVEGEKMGAYWEHVRLFMQIYRPAFVTYDHYQFTNSGDNSDYFLNMSIIRQNAAAAGVPFFNGVQACTWVPGSAASPSSPRIPGPDEMRYLVYTTLAYGAQGIYYYVYSRPRHEGAIVELDGTKSDKYEVLKTLNREFVVLAKELRGHRFVGAYVQGAQARGTSPYCAEALLRLSPLVESTTLEPGKRFENSILVTRFDAPGEPSRLMVVNLDYKTDRTISAAAVNAIWKFEVATGVWSNLGKEAQLELNRGSGVLLRTAL